jgi:hypothetical protein
VKPYHIGLAVCGSALHLADLDTLRERQLSIPHDYSMWPLHTTTGTWHWCRVLNVKGRLITGFAVELTWSRAIPGTRIGRVTRVGRKLHEEVADDVGIILRQLAQKIPLLLRLDVRIFEEDPMRRQRLRDSLKAAGWSLRTERRDYSYTLVLQLASTHDEVLKEFSQPVRRQIQKALGSPALRFAPIEGDAYEARMRYLYTLTFRRTGCLPPPIDVAGILRTSSGGKDSLLVGAFACDGQKPYDLVAFLWARLHSDHAVIEVQASDRSPLVKKLSPGFGLMSHLIGWSFLHNAQWIDLGGIPSMYPEVEDHMRGVVQFKTRFSSDAREVGEEWQLAPSPLLAAAAVAVRSVAKLVGGVRQHASTEPG